MTPARIQYELKKKAITQAAIAREAGVTESMMSLVVHQKMTSDRLMRLVAEKIDRDYREVFSEYYSKKQIRERAAKVISKLNA